MDGLTEGTLAVVFLGNRFVELSEDGVTLQEVCEAFGVPYSSGVFVQHKASGQPVATLPFDPVFSLASSSSAEEHRGEDKPDGADDEDGPIVLELVCPSGGDRPDSGEGGGGAAEDVARQEPANEDGVSDVEVKDVEEVLGPDGAVSATMGIAMRELVKLGAVELLSADSPQRIAQMPPYNANEAPGLLRRCIYPAAQYSPFRMDRDPLHDTLDSTPQQQHGQRHPQSTRWTGFTAPHRDGAPYVAAFDAYGADMASEEDLLALINHGGASSGEGEEEERVAALLLRQRPDLTPLSAEEHQRYFP